MKRIELMIPTALLAVMCLPIVAAAQSADELPPALLACSEETDVARRLECFDREMAKMRPAPEAEAPPAPEPTVAESAPEPAVAESAPMPEPAAAEPAPAATSAAIAAAPTPDVVTPAAAVPAAPAAAAAAAATASAASTVESEPAPSPAPAQSASAAGEDFGLPAEGPNEISAKVTNIMERPYGELVILLDNGQIWEQKHRDNRFRLDIGDDVTISEGLVSGFRMTGGGRNNSIQVERLK